MRADHITLFHLRMPLRFPFETSFGRSTERDCVVIKVSAEGLVGFGECVADRYPGYGYETSGTAWLILRDFLGPAVLQRDVIDPMALGRQLSSVRGHLAAKAGLELAFWDLWGKMRGASLSQLLGGDRARVPVGVSIGIQSSPEVLVSTVSAFIQQGYQRVKIKIKPGRDIMDTCAVRRAFPLLALQVDANCAYQLSNAAALHALDDLGLLMIEQPLAEDDLWDHSRLQRQLKTPLCLDESILSERHARQAIEMGSCRVINIKPGRVGGLAQARAIHDLCLSEGIPVWCGGMLETGIGRAANLALASLPGFTLPGDISATDRYYATDVIEEAFTLNADGTISVPDTPGLGISLDMDRLKQFSISQLDLTSG